MRGVVAFLALLLLAGGCAAPGADIVPLGQATLYEPILDFDAPARTVAASRSDWMMEGSSWPGYRVGMAKVSGMTGDMAPAIAVAGDGQGHGGIVQAATAIEEWRGKRVRLWARLKSEDAGRLRLWMTVHGPASHQIRRYDMTDRPITGTTDWTVYTVVMDVPEDARMLNYGFFLDGGKGTAYGDAFTLEEVGQDVATTPLAGIGSDGWQRRDPEAAMANAAAARAARAAHSERMRQAELARQRGRTDVFYGQPDQNGAGFKWSLNGGLQEIHPPDAVTAYDNFTNRQMNANNGVVTP